MTSVRIVGLFILHDTMNAERYLAMLKDEVWPIIIAWDNTGWPISHFTFYKLNNFFSINIFLFFFSEFKNIILVNFWYGKVYNRTTSEDN